MSVLIKNINKSKLNEIVNANPECKKLLAVDFIQDLFDSINLGEHSELSESHKQSAYLSIVRNITENIRIRERILEGRLAKLPKESLKEFFKIENELLLGHFNCEYCGETINFNVDDNKLSIKTGSNQCYLGDSPIINITPKDKQYVVANRITPFLKEPIENPESVSFSSYKGMVNHIEFMALNGIITFYVGNSSIYIYKHNNGYSFLDCEIEDLNEFKNNLPDDKLKLAKRIQNTENLEFIGDISCDYWWIEAAPLESVCIDKLKLTGSKYHIIDINKDSNYQFNANLENFETVVQLEITARN